MRHIDSRQKSVFGEDAIGVWMDDDYYAAVFQEDGAVRLDIVRHDLRGGLTWDDLRQIKNACGFGDKDAIEFYPKESSVINTGNVRHLYIFDQDLPIIRRPA